MLIKPDSIDLTQFYVTEKNGRFLVKPRPDKHVWAKDELHLRSLLLDADGNILSSGFPKFLNYGQCDEDDAELAWAIETGQPVSMLEKLDGTLIIVDQIDGDVHFRTRGSHDLGEFEGPVMRLVHGKYPGIIGFMKSNTDFCRDCSLLFEYTGPENRIVVKYDEPQLTYLDYVDKRGKTYWTNAPTPQGLSLFMGGVPIVKPAAELNNALFNKGFVDRVKEIRKIVAAWKDREGVVARFRGRDRTVKRVKIKADQYLRLHTLKFRLNVQRAKELAFLCNITDPTSIKSVFHTFGIDEEAVAFVEEEVTSYVVARAAMRFHFEWRLRPLAQGLVYYLSGMRKEYVLAVKHICKDNEFPVMMRIFDGKFSAAMDILEGGLLGLPPVTIAKLREQTPDTYVDAMMKVQVDDDA